ncbi:MAG TPA: glutamyl-tRNA reductase [Verrucomicrobiae bacterium]|jgi:glutamyl-tRNA reductase
MALVCLGLSHRTAPLPVRERFAIAEARVPATLQLLRETGLADEAVILSTCNRVELYAVTALEPARAFAELQSFLTNCVEYRDPLNDELYKLSEPASIEHLFRVACGLDSMVLGETEVLGQLKKAYELALQHKFTGGRLNKAFQKAFNVAKHIRTETNIQRGATSVAAVAVELAEKIFSALSGHQVMVIGAGDTSEKAARALLSRGAQSVIVANRTYDRAAELAKELNGRAVHWDRWSEEFDKIDIVISSTAAPHHIIDRSKIDAVMKRRRGRPLLLIDIAVPRDIEPEVNFLDNVYLYNVDDLQAIADDYIRQRKEEIVRCDAIIRDRARELTSARPPQTSSGAQRPAFGHD